MTSYRRNVVSGASFFFTVNLADRRQRLLVDNIELLRAAFREVRARHPFTVEAAVVLPEHIHTIWTLPEGDGDYAMRWRQIKSLFSRGLPSVEYLSRSRSLKGERGIWQRRYWEHTLRDDDDFARHVDYIHYNPVKHGHAPAVGDWPYSSFARMMRESVYCDDWGGNAGDNGENFGER
jgi:putative transposase